MAILIATREIPPFTEYPFPYFVIENAFDPSVISAAQAEIISLPDTAFDTYNNPFERKLTLRDKTNLSPTVASIFEYFESREFIDQLEKISGLKLQPDTHKHYHGIHIQRTKGDKLDVHLDAGIHPISRLTKAITVGLYLSVGWDAAYGGGLELWSSDNNALTSPEVVIPALPGTLVVFKNTANAYHGGGVVGDLPPGATRIFLTVSYMSDCEPFNPRERAYFVPYPGVEDSTEMKELREKRSRTDGCRDVYRSMA